MDDPEALIAESRRRAPPRPGRTHEPESCLHELFETSAARRPAAVALSFGELDVPYSELDRRAARLARRLRRLGVGPECLAGLCLERSVEMVVAILGVLKAGGAYLPLDPDYPEDRLRFMWRDSRAAAPPGAPAVLLGLGRTAGRLERLAEGTGAAVVLLDGAPEAGDETDRGPLPRAETGVAPRHLAYVIYTSGSTGRPKGVMIEHRSVVNVVRHAARALEVTPGSRVLQLASLSFDASVLEIFTAFAAGARLVLTPRETLLSGEALGEELRRRGITTLAIPPSLLDRVPDGVSLPALRAIVVGGEACSAATARRWAPGRVFVNAYAPTEATIYTTAAACAGPYDRPPAMGRPIPGTAARVLDAEGRPVPGGELGELCLGGLGLARGYAGRPGLTAERFVPDALAGRAPGALPGSRLYRSGDLGRRLADGGLEFAGRADHQVKVRGLRIELGEIEAVLAACPGVRQAVVARREDLPGEPRLVGYVVPEPGARPPVGELRSFLAERLPEAMVPSAFVALDALPRTATGKIDRRALPAPGPERPDLSTAYAPPEGTLEIALALIWGEVLSLERVGAEDDLFELGGHSLVVAQIAARVRRELGLEMPLLAPFEHPTVRALAVYLAARVEPGSGEAAATGFAHRLPPVEPAPRDRPIPVTFPQEAIWFLLQLAPGSVAYNFQFSLRFRGDLAVPALCRALTELVRRHEILRTSFPAEDGRPVQRIHPPFPARMPVVDLSRLPPAERERRLPERVRAELGRGFDVTRLPLLRWTLFRLGAGDHLLLQVEHHFVHDGWSLAVYLDELRELYTAFRAGEPSPLPEPAMQYADFAHWQRRFMAGEVLEEELGYWRGKLAGSPPLLELPVDRPRPRAASFRGGCLRVDVDPALYRELRAFSRRQGATLFMTMLAVFDTLLYRYTGQRDLVLGSGLANRRLREAEGLVGMVVNTVVIRTALDGATTFRKLLEAVRRSTLELHLHQDLPFEKLVERLQPDRDLSHNPLFQVLFSFHDAPVPDLDLPGVAAELFEWHNGSAKTDLNVVVKPVAEQRVGRRASPEDETLTMVWEYSGDIFERATIERMWGHYRNLLAAVVADPETTLSRLPLLTAVERHQMLVEWNAPAAPHPRERSLSELFAAEARRRPEAVAVSQGERSWSYGELARRAAGLARRLRALGVGPDVPVGLCVERSPELVAGVLGILEAGGAYVPLDPVYPPERLAFMLEDALAGVASPVVVTQERFTGLVAGGGARRLVLLDGEGGGEEPPTGAGGPPTAEPTADNLAYVIYTSGSTGRPKGVQVTHGNAVRLLRATERWFDFGPDDVWTLFHSYAFDFSVWELWGALAYGGRLALVSRDVARSPEAFHDLLAGQGVTVLNQTPSAFRHLARVHAERGFPALALRWVIFGGEALDPSVLAGWIAHHGHRRPRLVNMYGITETTVHVTWRPIAPSDLERPGASPVGVPIPDLSVQLLDPWLEPVPTGAIGEMFVGGAGLARGYLGRPGLTAERFVPDPFATGPGARRYKSGDLARRWAGGDLEYLGRIDHQVKIRGFRIELGEIEAALAELPEVAEAVVVTRRDGPASEAADDLRLVAYLVPRRPPGASGLEAADLRRALAARLPEYMVPAAFVVLEALPLSPTGKVDRRALPAPELADPAAAAGRAAALAPVTPTEELIAALWRQVLGVEAVGVDDDFFHLGGHSLLATRLLARLRDATGTETPLADLFEAPTVAALARRIEARLREPGGLQEADGLAIPRRGDGGPAALSFAQERLWFLDRLTPGEATYNVARALRLDGPLDAALLAGALAEVARRHEILRTRFDDRGGRPVQVADLPPPRLAVVDLGALAGGERAEAAMAALGRAESRRPFDLGRGPLARSALVRLGGGRHVLLLTLHHAVCDGWSMEIFFRELGEAYRQLAAGRPPSPPPLPIQYADFAVWQREHLAGDRLERLLDYWRGRLAGAPAALDLPADRPRPRTLSQRGAREALPLAPSLAAAVAELALRRAVTPFMVYLAGFAALLARYTGQCDLVMGTPMASRTRTEVQALIGFFANTLVLRLDAGGDPSLDELLPRVRRAVLEAYSHQEVPFEKLVEELAPDRDLSRAPLFQITFQVEERESDLLDLPGVAVQRLDLARAESKFDLSVALSPGPAGLLARAHYSTDLFDPTRMRRMLGHLGHLLAAAAARPELAIAQLPLLGAGERLQVLAEWNDTAVPYPRERSIPELFGAEARRRPEAVAVAQGERWWSYGELERRSARVAARLVAAGVGPEVLVGLAAERSPELVAGLLGILRAGGAYLPLDPAYPAERLAFMLEDGRVPVLLASQALADRLPAAGTGGAGGWAPRVLSLAAAVAAPGPDDPAPELAGRCGPRSLAYALYTSGSTGRPKGVAVEHRSVVRLVKGAGCAGLGSAIGEEEVFLQLAPVPFDASTLEIWGPLLNGGRLELLPSGTPSLAELGRAIERSRVTALWLTAGLFHQMVDSELPRLAGVGRLLAGGDVLSPPHVARVRSALAPGQELINGYGPTEGTTFTCCHRMAPLAAEAAGPVEPVPIGRPIPNTRVYLAAAGAGGGLEPVPPGVPGELYLGGDGVARGYLARPALTAAAFVPDPFGPREGGEPGARLYRTGDLARWRPGGEVEFLGRIDGQVKLRGFRIELGEVEAALLGLPEVAEAAVVVRSDRSAAGAADDRRLVAYLVPREPPGADVPALRRALAERLPEYMIPTAFVFLEALPLGPTGKVDHRALPAPEAGRGVAGGPRREPRTETERLLAGLWRELMGCEGAGPDDDFFDLGGHSLLATRLVSRLRDALGIELPLRLVFEHRTLGELAAAIGEAAAGAAPPLARLPRPEGARPASFAPSFAQERLWFLDRLEPDSAFYNVPVSLRVAGDLRPPVLERVLDELRRRHETLRTTLPAAAGSPVQHVAPPRPSPLPRVDLAGLPPAARRNEARRLAEAEAERPFDLAEGPLFRARLLDLGTTPAGGSREHRLLLTLHHIVSDGWSIGVLLDEVTGLYAALAAGRPADLPAPPVQYADFAAWQRSWLAGPVLEEQLGYWRRRLAGVPAALELPTDRPRPAVQTFRGGRLPFRLERELTEDLAELGRRSGATSFMVLLAAFLALLARHTGERDLVIGSPIAGRNRREVEGLIGLFVNTLVLRVDLGSDPAFDDVLEASRAAALGAFSHQDLPFERLVQEVVPERDLSRAPLFQVMFALQNEARWSRRLPGLELEVLEADSHHAKFDLTLSLAETPEGLRGSWQFNSDLFDRTTCARLAARFRTLLAGAVADSASRLSHLPVVAGAERHQLLVEWNDTDPAPPAAPAGSTLSELFAAQARATPEAVAVVWGDRRLSYRELDRRAGEVAAELRRLGVGPEARVGVRRARTPELVASLLGVLEAGAAYVPLDPAYPAERVAFMLEDSGAVVVLTDDGPRPGPGAAAARSPAAAAAERDGAGRLAYVLYTSGSTGRPKAVAVEHGSAVALLRWARGVFSPAELTGVLASTSVCFDLSVFELFLPLTTGGTVILAADALELPRLAAAGEVTLVNTVPSAMAELLRQGGVPPSARTINLAGEPLRRRLAAEVYDGTSAERLYNLYGPSEDTTYSTFCRVPPEDGREPSIGRPVAGTRAYVLDADLSPVPMGVHGEIHLAGEGLARGYLGRPRETAERFVPDPFGASWGRHGERLYRTGDLARSLPDGELAFLGRSDHQVKLRGFRIELGEIESVLAAHPRVRSAAALVREDRPGDRRLVAYAAPADGEAPEPRELRSYLAARLPESMVPAAYVILPELPLNPNGKVDRRALPPPGEGSVPVGKGVPPRSPLEELVAGIWAEVLAVDAVGVHDGFFELGGHSLLATRVVSRLADLTGVELPLRRLFEAPTVAGLAAALEELRRGARPTSAPALTRRPAGQTLAPASFAQERLWFLDRFDPGSTVYNVPAVFRFRGGLRAPILARALREVVRRHEALRTVFVEVDGRPFQEVRPFPPAALPCLDLSGLSAEAAAAEASRLAGRSAHQAFDLAAGPLWAAWLLRLSEREHRLAWCVHHVAADGWSLGLILRELTILYDAWSRARPSPLPEPPVQYADFAAWQRQDLGAGALAEQVEHWRRRLAGAPRALELPTDRPRPPQQTFRGERAARFVAPEVLSRLLAFAAGEGATLFMLLLAALDTVLARWSGQRDVLVGSPVAGRTRSEIEGLVGMFLNTLVLRLELSGDGAGDPSFRELLGRAREAALDAYSHQDVPFEMLLEALGVERELSRTPLFQVFLNVTNFPRDRVPLAGLEVEVLDGEEAPGSKFDLTLYAGPSAGGLALKLVYNADLFDRTRMEELLDQVTGLLDQVAADPDRAFTAYTLRTPAVAALLPDPAQELSDRWRGAVHEVFAARAAEAPERVAVIGPGVAWTYGALDRATDRLARALVAAGVARGDRAAIYAERCPSLPLAVLGVLRAGAAFVVLDPAPPPRHLVEIAERSRPRAVVRLAAAGPVPQALAEALARLAPAIDLELPRPGVGPPEGEPLAGWRAADPDRPPPLAVVGRDDHAYIAFTSGTTGKPKGILGRHGPLSHFIPWQRRRLGLGPDDRYSMLSGLAHDPLQRDMFTPLQTGATLCVPPPEDVLRPARLFAWMACERVSVAHLTPAMGQLLVNGAAEGEGEGEGLPALRRAFLVGEQLSAALVDELARLAPRLACFNFYGTTETQRAVGFYPVPPNAARRFRTGIPLGHGIEDVQLLVLGAAGGLAGVAELGEIALRSPHLARGYLDDPGLTAARFTPDPFGSGALAGGRIYRTGDLGRYLPDGAVEFTTRADDQVQVRGFRVELGAVETALAEHPAVAEAAVAARPGPDGTYLVGYLVPAAGAAPAAEELRSHLAERLPGYMVPGVFVTLDALPLTRTAKVDRRALPAPGSALVVAAGFEPASSPVEELLAEIWRDLLRVERVGAGDDFFALGGHSLLATRVVSRLRLEVDLELPLRTLFERPRLRDLAEAVEELLLAGETEALAGLS